MISKSNPVISEDHAKELLCSKKFTFDKTSSEKERLFSETLEKHLAKPVITKTGDQISFFSEKGRLSPLAFYLTHAGILIIIIGVLIGAFGFKGYIQLFEGQKKDKVMLWDFQRGRSYTL